MNELPPKLQNSAAPQLDLQLDPQLDRLLDHLAAAQPPAGFNERLLRNLSQQEADARARSSRFVAPAAGRRGLWVVLLAPTVLAALLLAFLFPTHRPQRETSPKAGISRSEPAPGIVDSRPQAARPRSSAMPPPAAEAPFPTTSPLVRPNPPRASTLSTLALSVSALRANPTPDEAQALSDLHAPSQPAPPMPLTAQEQLLTRMLRRNNGVQLAQLAPNTFQPSPGSERAAFQRFFDPPPLPQLEDPPSSPPSASPSTSSSQGKQ